jgi:hypothetical protein
MNWKGFGRKRSCDIFKVIYSRMCGGFPGQVLNTEPPEFEAGALNTSDFSFCHPPFEFFCRARSTNTMFSICRKPEVRVTAKRNCIMNRGVFYNIRESACNIMFVVQVNLALFRIPFCMKNTIDPTCINCHGNSL